MNIIRLNTLCNNRCFFCMVKNERTGIPPHFEDIASSIESYSNESVIDIFGGEPTCYPDFLKLLKLLYNKNIKFQLATNARKFASSEYVHIVKQTPPVHIRTSVYGLAPTHDFLTGIPGSFAETKAGVENIIKAGIKCKINYLILDDNANETFETTKIFYQSGIRDFKFSLPINALSFNSRLATYDTARRVISKTTSWLQSTDPSVSVTIEKAPFCIAPHLINYFFMENDSVMIAKKHEIYSKSAKCNECVLSEYCNGIENGYHEAYSDRGVIPLKWEDINSRIINLQVDKFMLYKPKFTFEMFHISDTFQVTQLEVISLLHNKLRAQALLGHTLALL